MQLIWGIIVQVSVSDYGRQCSKPVWATLPPVKGDRHGHQPTHAVTHRPHRHRSGCHWFSHSDRCRSDHQHQLPQSVPAIASTAAWGARPSSAPVTVLSSKPVKIIVHHTAAANSNDFSQAHAFALSRSIQNYHMDNNGWIDTGQHFTNSRGGWMTEGRHRSLEVLTDGTRHVVSAHASGQNNVALGIENEGLYTSVNVTNALWNSLVTLCRYMCDQYGINPTQIFGHRDFNSTECPGNVLYSRLPELRQAVGASAWRLLTWPLLRPGDAGPQVQAAQHLLRFHGLTDVPADGIYGPATEAATRRFTVANKITIEPCYASAQVDESGLLGAGTWPLLVRTVRADDPSEAGQAARVLLAVHGNAHPATVQEIDTETWQSLLA